MQLTIRKPQFHKIRYSQTFLNWKQTATKNQSCIIKKGVNEKGRETRTDLEWPEYHRRW